ncbi:MAG: hypothetical protein QNJ65_19745 [Xenococcaceae cyanobacterium MO_234.B1]|nr:hypothetical protein [Xenococcaceae cyanobacterium MO_234.B1]
MEQLKCPRCSSEKIRTNGTTKTGTTRYRCKDCHKSWSQRPIGRPPKGLVAMTNAERQKLHRQRKRAKK